MPGRAELVVRLCMQAPLMGLLTRLHVPVLCVVQGPREDSGFSSAVDPGQRLASQVYTYVKKFHPKTQVMASGLRTKDGE